MIGKIHNPPCGQVYFVSPLHRMAKATVDKSVWIISVPEEIACFNNTITQTWYVADTAWGILLGGAKNNLDPLGINYEESELSIAKFVQGAGQWHGYPADVNRNPHDRPHPDVLDSWIANNLISKPFRARIQGGRI